ncbi:histidine kinase [Mucilaginibacter paludis DSM 18603]|uniref:histidine kinase n=2 Tax=Mucilaginibacter TaxID=423349 RepID=H1Y5W3_9SPHI|nr:histidine kinase [Mucilaginibacter paludis DSM 18603]
MLFAFAWSGSYAQQAPDFTSLTTKNGLSSNVVNAVLKDSYGWVWFATADGLNRFDGTNFTVYRHRDGDPASLPVNEILSMYEDRSGRLWIGTGGGGLVYYDRTHDAFQQYGEGAVWRKNRTEPVLAICGDHLGRLWISGFNGIRIIDLKTNKIANPPFINSKLPVVALGFLEDSKHRMWAGTNLGLFCYNLNTCEVRQYLHNKQDKKSIGPGIIKGIAEDNSGHMWFGTSNGLSALQADGKAFNNFLNNQVFAIATDNGFLWLGTDNGLVIFNTRNLKSERYQPGARNNYSLSTKAISSIYIDKSGIYWLGTNKGGVNKFDRNLPLLNVKLNNPFDPQGLAGPNTNAFAEQANGNIYIGTDNGLQLFDKNTGLFRSIHLDPKEETPENRIAVLCLKCDKAGKLWIGTLQHGLYILDPSSGRCEHIVKGNGVKHISQNDVYAIEEDQLGRIWIGTNGGGVDIYDPKTGQLYPSRQFFNIDGLDSKIINNFIRTITPVNSDEMWVGTWGGGITVFNINTRSVAVYNKAGNALPNNLVLSVFQDEAGKVWVTTNGGGIDEFDAKSVRFKPYLENEGLINDIIYKVLQDKNGLLWLSTSRGIVSVDLHTHKTNSYGKQNGVQDSPFISGSGLETANGMLFFGGQDGFNYFYPQQLPENNKVSKVVLTGLKIDNNPVSARENSPIKQQISMVKEIHLAYHQNFSISYTALNYTDARQDQYSYMLKGFDSKWNYVGHTSTAYFTNLDPGSYTFLVRASNSKGVWNTEPTTVLITVSPPWWRTVYAYIIYLLSAAGVLLYLRYRGIMAIKTKLAIEEEKRETQRMRELDVMKINFLTNLSHEFRTPISLIMAPLEKLAALPTGDHISKEVSVIKRNTRRLLNLVNQLLDFRKMEHQELRLNLSGGDLIGFIRDAADSFRDISERKKIRFEFQTEIESLQARFDSDKVERIVFNLLSNAFKFTSAGGFIKVKLSLILEAEVSSLQITVSDSGIGIPESDQARIFEKFFQHDTPDIILNQGSGIGLSIVKEFIELHGGEVTVMSKPGQGTTFNVVLPVIALDENKVVVTPIPHQYQEAQPGEVVKVPGSEKYSILLVDDNDDFRNYLKESLEKSYTVTEATNGKDGWQKALSGHPDLVVSDVSMPVMDGIELCRKIKTDKRTSFIPVILLTALGREEDHIRGLQTEANDYLTKPFSFEILNTRIKNMISLNQRLKNTFSKQIQMMVPEMEVPSADEKLLHDVSLFIEDRLNDSSFSIEDLSKHLNVSRSSLYNKIFSLTGQPPIDYVRTIKLQKAASLLEKSQYTIRQIAFMTGFATPGYFSKLFKEKYNLSPSEFVSLKRSKTNKIQSPSKPLS